MYNRKIEKYKILNRKIQKSANRQSGAFGLDGVVCGQCFRFALHRFA